MKAGRFIVQTQCHAQRRAVRTQADGGDPAYESPPQEDPNLIPGGNAVRLFTTEVKDDRIARRYVDV